MTEYFANTRQVRAKKRRNTDVFRVFFGKKLPVLVEIDSCFEFSDTT